MEQYHGTWGNRVVTRDDGYVLTTILWLQPHRVCSWHKHEHNYNQFFVISGKLGVKTNSGPGDECQTTVLKPKQFFTVPPGVKHRFETYEDSTVIEEIAFVKYDKGDIQRETLGGPLDGFDDKA